LKAEVKELFRRTKTEGEYNDDYNDKILDLFEFDKDMFAQAFFIDDELVAFNLGAKMNEQVAIYIINKNLPEFKYLVDYSRFEFHNECRIREYWYVNDGSDLDREGLRRLKRKFNPLSLLPIKRVVLR